MKRMDPQSESMASQQLKKMIPQLLLSLSLFSFIFSYLSSSLLHSPKFHYYSSVNSFHLLRNALNKNYLFLICNGLLVFLAKTSGLIRPPAAHDLDDVLQKRIGDTLQTALEKYVLEEVTRETREEEEDEREKSESPKEVSIFIAESEEEGGGACDLEDGEEKEENQPESRSFWLFYDDDGDDEQKLYGEEVEGEDDDEEEEEEEGEREETSTEELNRKFEDFIRRVKEEIIINEARQKAVMVK